MFHEHDDRPFRVAFFSNAGEADQAVRRLLEAGFTKEQLAVICPEPFDDQVCHEVPRAEHPGSHAAAGIMTGEAVGAALGGVALAATAIATGGVGLLPAIPVLIGGGALAGAFSGLILADGYGKEIGEYYEEAIRLGRIVVGVEVEGPDSTAKLAEAEVILASAGGTLLMDMKESNA